MIKRYTDHAANERTYLAWIRTSISIMAFGFLIEKFDLFVQYLGNRVGDEEHFQPSLYAELSGLLLFFVGILMVVAATVRFFTYKKHIESEQMIPYSVKKTNIMLSTSIILISLFLVIYMAYKVIL